MLLRRDLEEESQLGALVSFRLSRLRRGGADLQNACGSTLSFHVKPDEERRELDSGKKKMRKKEMRKKSP